MSLPSENLYERKVQTQQNSQSNTQDISTNVNGIFSRSSISTGSLAPTPTLTGRLTPALTGRLTPAPIGRLAPSPTGHLHLGNAWAFLLAWLAARVSYGSIYLRMEDIDPQRANKKWAADIVHDLKWLGLDWDGEIVWQSERGSLYEDAMKKLNPFVYPCSCTRKDLRSLASAPQVEQGSPRLIMPDMGAPYLGTCRIKSFSQKGYEETLQGNYSVRIACPPFSDAEQIYIPKELQNIQQSYTFIDSILGEQTFSLAEIGGDFVLCRSDKVWSYQLAVSIDDMLMNINQVVRGEDILTSTPRQLYLSSLLGGTVPTYTHIPLLCDENGDRLAKRHQSLTLKSLQEKGVSSETVVRFLLEQANLECRTGNILEACEILRRGGGFPWENLPRQNICTSYKNLA